MTQLVFPKELVEKIFLDVKQKAPEEACGVLGGRIEEEKNFVLTVYVCRNVSTKPKVAYSIAPEDLAKAFTDIESRGLEILGFYHSHPFGLVKPSETDKSGVTWYNEFYVISNLKKEITAWKWDRNQRDFVEEEIVILESRIFEEDK
ncbi:MAG: M67 family metallopeptidase [Promethearchaeota archaeon]